MNNSKTPKIVVGLGLAVAYASIAFYFLRDKPAADVAQVTTPEPVAQVADVLMPPPVIDPVPGDMAPPSDVSTGLVPQPEAVPNVPPPVVRAAPARAESPSPRAEVSRPEPVRQERAEAPAQAAAPSREPTVADAAAVAAQAEPATQVEVPMPAAQMANEVGGSPDASADPALPVATAVSPAGNDSQITAEVKAEIASIAPAGTIDVTTTNGVVELTGSVHSQEDVERVRTAARNVPAVRDVDVSALMVSN